MAVGDIAISPFLVAVGVLSVGSLAFGWWALGCAAAVLVSAALAAIPTAHFTPARVGQESVVYGFRRSAAASRLLVDSFVRGSCAGSGGRGVLNDKYNLRRTPEYLAEYKHPREVRDWDRVSKLRELRREKQLLECCFGLLAQIVQRFLPLVVG